MVYDSERANNELLKKLTTAYEANEKNLNLQNELKSKEIVALKKELGEELIRVKNELQIALKDKNLLLKKQETLKQELQIAQQKCSGHYAKLEYEQKVTTTLKKQILLLESNNKKIKETLTWSLGEALLKAKTIKGFLLLPINLISAYIKYYRRKKTICNIVKDKDIDAEQDKKISDNIIINDNTLIVYKYDSYNLTLTPFWIDIKVESNDIVLIKASTTYDSNINDKNRKAVLLFKFINTNNEYIEYGYGNLSKSEQLGAHFVYLPSTNGNISNICKLNIQSNVAILKIGFCKFNINSQNNIVLDTLEISVIKEQGKLFISPSKDVADLSILGWPDYSNNEKPCVVGIVDEFTAECLGDNLNLIQPRPDNWYALSEKYKPIMFFIESAWQGNFGSWQYRIGNYSNSPGNEIEYLTRYAKQKNIPTLFWNKEDPISHQKFIHVAKLVDHIFTTDTNMMESYKKNTGNNKVYALQFAAATHIHKPSSIKNRINRICFAGSWYGEKFLERTKTMEWLLDAGNKYKLDIYDRNFGSNTLMFPEKYQKNIKGSLNYSDICKKYSEYKIFLNVNSIADSATMFSRRVFELMACGTPIVSIYSKGIEETFQNDIVWQVKNRKEADNAISTLLTDDKEWRRRSLLGIREVFAKHTYTHRLNQIFADMNINVSVNTEPSILLLSNANTMTELNSLLDIADKQEYRNFLLLIACSKNINYFPKIPNVDFVLKNYFNKIDFEQKIKDYYAVGWISLCADYGKYYLIDLVNAISYRSDAKGWAKSYTDDIFDFGHKTYLDSSIWKIDFFMKELRYLNPSDTVCFDDLFSIDSDEYKKISGINYE
jgi:glycosyltransferase involved in cell wall biosynthesis